MAIESGAAHCSGCGESDASLTQASGVKPKLLDQVRTALRSRHYSKRTEQSYVNWIKRYIFFHHVRHPAEMGEVEVNESLSYLGNSYFRRQGVG